MIFKATLTSAAVTSKEDYYQSHLDRVSRSFSFCIRRLESPLRTQVGLGYLLCRLVDTVEDANWSSFEDQRDSFHAFDSFIATRPGSESVANWVQNIPRPLPEGEEFLLQDAHQLFNDFHDLDIEPHEALKAPIESMSAGMKHFMSKKIEGRLRLSTLADVNRYCFFVAGVVGEMLTRLTKINTTWSVDRSTLGDAFRFGLFLQKINLLKDQKGDEVSGRYLVPSRSELKTSLNRDAEAAFRYLVSLPVRVPGFRLFCAWSFFLGLASLPWIDRAFREGSNIKIPRVETAALLAKIESRIESNEALEDLFEALKPRADYGAGDIAQGCTSDGPSNGDESKASIDVSCANDAESTTAPSVLLALYRGALPQDEVLDLFAAV